MHSPTFALLMYVRDTIAGDDSLLLNRSNAEGLVTRADRFIRFANVLQDADDEVLHRDFVHEASEIAGELETFVNLPMSTYSLVINWADHDREQGTFGTSVRAWSDEHAEAKARAEMEATESGSDFTGSVVEQSKGAAWLAERMEAVLRRLSALEIEGEAFAEAKAIVAEIDAL